jgi:hypothetical protein
VSRLVKSNPQGFQKSLWLVTWLIALCTILAVFRNGLTTSASQGRFLFPAMGALSLLMMTGWHDLLSERLRKYLPAFIILLFMGCNLWLWLTGVIPIYYQPFLD